jgi:3-methyladenine DNA glycosylase AlkD
MNASNKIKKELRSVGNKEKAKILSGFFKTGPDQYGEGDVFLGIAVPVQRKIAKKYYDLPLREVVKLLHSKEHEFRLTALIILVEQFMRARRRPEDNSIVTPKSTTGALIRKKIFDTYLTNTKWINNWDLVDVSAPKIVGHYLYEQSNKGRVSGVKILEKLAHSNNLWEKRIAIISTLAFIVNGRHEVTFMIAKILLNDGHDLIHKAVGWMLREVGKRCGRNKEIAFLNKHYKKMPRTMLRYAIEHFSTAQKARYITIK